MGQLLFFDEGHKYELDGSVIPSVSEILRFISREVYQDVQQYRLDTAAHRGTDAHKATELLDKYGECDCDASIEPYVQAYIKFRSDHKCEWSGIEKTMANEGLRYAGTLDRIGIVDGRSMILDIKCQSTIHKPLVKAQLNGYLLMVDKPHDLACLQLLNTGKYRLYQVDVDPTEFMACYDLHKAMQRKHEKGRIN